MCADAQFQTATPELQALLETYMAVVMDGVTGRSLVRQEAKPALMLQARGGGGLKSWQ